MSLVREFKANYVQIYAERRPRFRLSAALGFVVACVGVGTDRLWWWWQWGAVIAGWPFAWTIVEANLRMLEDRGWL